MEADSLGEIYSQPALVHLLTLIFFVFLSRIFQFSLPRTNKDLVLSSHVEMDYTAPPSLLLVHTSLECLALHYHDSK